MRGIVIVALLAAFACSSATPARVTEPHAPDPLIVDVTEDEWQAALPAEVLHLPMPQRVSGPKQPGIPDIPSNSTAHAALEIVFRTDGSVGLRRVIAAAPEDYARFVMRWLRLQRFAPVIREGRPVAIRGKYEMEHKRTAQ